MTEMKSKYLHFRSSKLKQDQFRILAYKKEIKAFLANKADGAFRFNQEYWGNAGGYSWSS